MTSDLPTTPSKPSGRKVTAWAGTLLIILSSLAAYHNSFSIPLLLDDEITIGHNPSIQHLWPLGPVLMPPDQVFSAGRPLLNLSFALNYAVGGSSVFGYHALNLLIHILAGLTLFGLVRRTLALPALREKYARAALPVALAVALLWTLHPLLTESVAYISQRAESLMGLFYLLTLYCFVRGAAISQPPGTDQNLAPALCRPELSRPSGRPKSPAKKTDRPRDAVSPAPAPSPSRWWHFAAVIACAFGMATKEVMVTAPVLVFFYDRCFLAGSFRAAWQKRWKAHLALAATWILLAGLMIGSHPQDRGVGYGGSFTWWTYALTECRVILEYLKLSFWPHPLVFDYGAEHRLHPSSAALVYVLLLGVLAATALRAWVRRPELGFLGAWFFVTLAPTSSVVPLVGQPMAENRMYLPLIAVVALLVFAAYFLIGRKSLPPLLALALGCGWLAAQRNVDYRSALAIWTDTVAKSPGNSRAQNSLGIILAKDPKRLDEAIAHYQRALQINPEFAEAYNNLANALARLPGRRPEAIAAYRTALRLKSDSPDIHFNLARALSENSKTWAEAAAQYEQALRLAPDLMDADYNLGNVLAKMGRDADAIPCYEAALRFTPGVAEIHYNLATALARTGHLSDAVEQFEAAVQLRPDFFEAHYNLAHALATLPGHLPEAAEQYEQAVRLKPDNAEAQNNLGETLAQIPGRLPEALAHFEATLKLQPDSTDAQYNLGNALAQMGRFAEAVPHYEAVLRLQPNSAAAHYNLGIVLAKIPDRLADAAAQYEAALHLKPDYAEAHNNLGSVLSKMPGRLPEAIAQFEAALQLNPGYLEAQYNFGNALAKAGRFADAVVHYEAALRLRPDSPEIHNNLGLALAQIPGRVPEAIAQFEAALEIRPDFAPARQMLDQLRGKPPPAR